jgi:plastocyanin
MRKLSLLLAAAAFFCVPALAQAATVTITAAGFVPAALTVDPNETVIVTNVDTADHQLKSDKKAGVASPVLHTGQSYSFSFAKDGKYTVQDSVRNAKLTITVRKPAAAANANANLTIAASTLQLVFGSRTMLSGTLSTRQAGQNVDVMAQAYGDHGFRKLATVVTGTGGTWSYTVKPTIRTAYKVQSGKAASPELALGVRPLVTFHVLAGNRFSTKAVAARSFAGKLLQFQRRSSFGQWVTLKRVKLNASSAAIFKANVPRGTSKLRIAMSVNQAGAGYLGGISRIVVYHET